MPKVTQTPMIETQHMLVLSTAHISQKTADALTANDETDQIVYYPKIAKTQDTTEILGWFIPVPPDSITDYPADLQAIMQFAKRLNCTWVMLDRDANAVSNLPIFDW